MELIHCAGLSIDFIKQDNRSNQDESKVPHLNLPDALLCNDGCKVTTTEEWGSIRCPGIVEIFSSKVVRSNVDEAD